MIHVGNDIVDLASPFSLGKSSDTRFVDRVLTPREKAFVCQSGQDANYFLWLHWAAKESAYKTVCKIWPDISSSPKKYDVSIQESLQKPVLSGVVHTPVLSVHFSVVGDNDFIHCISTCHPHKSLADIWHAAERIDHLFQFNFLRSSENQSNHVRNIAQKKIATCLAISPEDITFGKYETPLGQAYPIVCLKGENTTIDISFSHDGRYVGYAFYICEN